LAIAQSASYLSETGMNAGRFLGLFAASRARLLNRGRVSGHGGLAASVRLSREALDPMARSILDILAVLGPGPFPISAMPELQTLLPALGDDLVLEDQLASLRKFSLIERGSKGVALHELVRDIAREVQEPTERRSALVLAAAALHVLVPEDPSRDADLVEFDSVAGHVDAVLEELRGEASIAPPFTGWLANKFGLYLQARGQDRRAEAVFRSAIEVVERGTDEDRHGLGSLYHNLGTILQDDDNLDGAEDAFSHALDLKRREDPDSLVVAITLSSLAMLQWKRAHYEEARKLLEQALRVYEREGDVPRAADALQDLAGIARIADPAAALRQLQESVTLARTAAVAWPEVCVGLGRIAEIYEDAEDFDAALSCLDEAVEISRANFANHRLASALAQRGHLRAVRGELPEAIADGEEALSVMVIVEPSGGLGSERRRGDLGIIHFEAGNLDRAVDLIVESYTGISRLVRRGHHSEVIAFGILCRALDFCADRPDLLARLTELLEVVGKEGAHD
jgi:tetratricopeptide (TPR) repeat protein